MPTIPQTAGNLAPREQPGSPRIVKDERGITVVRKFRGRFIDLEDLLLATGTNHATMESNYNGEQVTLSAISDDFPADVRQSTLEKQEGAMGLLTVELSDYTDPMRSRFPVETETRIELDWQRVSRPLEQHPRYQTGGTAALTEQDRRNVVKLIDAPDSSVTLSTNAQELYQKRLAGVDSYDLYIPVVRRVSHARTRPSGFDAGGIATPPEFGSLANAWLKTADRVHSPGSVDTWERSEEWTGFDAVDTDLYA